MLGNLDDVKVEFTNPIGIDKSNLGNLLHYFGGFSEDLKIRNSHRRLQALQ